VGEAALDEVRLAVGEACSRAVGLHRSNGVEAPVRVMLNEDEKTFSIEVADEVPGNAHGSSPDSGGDEAADDEGEMGLAVISGLVDDVEVIEGTAGGVIRMSWPTPSA
jgi:anti-sigma regulatory factor (Ser/Thr protein kinase)